MLFAIASLFLTAILMTQANVIEDDVTNTEPLSEEVFIFDVISDATPAELKGSLKSAGVEIRHSFQVLGTRQYFFAVVGDLSQLFFPEGSEVTQYPAEHMGDFHKLTGANGYDGKDSEKAVDEKNLVLGIWDMAITQGTSTAQFKERIQAWSAAYKGANKELLKLVVYAVVGRYPPKFFFFLNLDMNAVQKSIVDGLDTAGGPGINFINVFRLRKF